MNCNKCSHPKMSRSYLVVFVRSVFIASIALVLLVNCGDVIDPRVSLLTSVETNQANIQVQESIARYQQRVSENPKDPIAVGNLGVIYELHGFSEEALIAYELATSLDPDALKWPYYHAILLAARFDLEKAIERINLAISKDPNYAPAWLQKGQFLLDASRYHEALASFEHAETIGDDPYAVLGQALAYLELNQPDEVLQTIQRVGSLYEHPNVRRLRANALIRSGKKEEASSLLEGLATYKRILWNDPIAEEKNEHGVDHMSVRLADAVRLLRNESYDAALIVLSELRVKYPTNRSVVHALGGAFELAGNTTQALSVYEEGVEHHPDFYVLRTAIASLLLQLDRLDEALVHLNRAIEIDPQLHWAHSQKAQVLMRKRQWLEASYVLNHAIRVTNDDADLYTHLGICMGFLDRWPEAANLFRVAISIEQDHVPAYINLARAETILNNEENALVALENARRRGASEAMLASVEKQRDQISRMKITTVKQ
ncbi:MAG: tetratricopeptide repeat protein [Gammaproteobacteria bacterium]|nr:tetratricopeptide repeat protein [Gammaproteobacteria bacterium]